MKSIFQFSSCIGFPNRSKKFGAWRMELTARHGSLELVELWVALTCYWAVQKEQRNVTERRLKLFKKINFSIGKFFNFLQVYTLNHTPCRCGNRNKTIAVAGAFQKVIFSRRKKCLNFTQSGSRNNVFARFAEHSKQLHTKEFSSKKNKLNKTKFHMLWNILKKTICCLVAHKTVHLKYTENENFKILMLLIFGFSQAENWLCKF